MSTKVTLEETLNTVDSLDEIYLPDHQPCIESLNGSILYQVNLDSNFEDKTAYVTGMSKYIEEAAKHAKLVTHKHTHILKYSLINLFNVSLKFYKE